MKKIALAYTLGVLGLFMTCSQAWADEALAKANNCMQCHSVDKKLVGPAFKDVAKKYAGDPNAATKLATKIQNGGSGVWGAVPMPPNASVNAETAKKLSVWIVSLK